METEVYYLKQLLDSSWVKLLTVWESDEKHDFLPIRDLFFGFDEYQEVMKKFVVAQASADFREAVKGPIVRLEACPGGGYGRIHGPGHGLEENTWTRIRCPEGTQSTLAIRKRVVRCDEGGSLFVVVQAPKSLQTKRNWREEASIQGVGLGRNGFKQPLRVKDPGDGEWPLLDVLFFGGEHWLLYWCASTMPRTGLAAAIMRPSERVADGFSKPRPGADWAEGVPRNRHQQQAVLGLRYNLEIISGPPGSGKSTIVPHIAAQMLRKGEAAYITCNTNKGINCMAEKFEASHKLENGVIRMLVIGSTSGLGPVAFKYTLDEQIKRDPDVVFWRNVVDRKNKWKKALEELQQRRMKNVMVKHTESRLREAELHADPKFRKILTDRRNRQRLLHQRSSEDAREPTAIEVHLEVLNRGKEKLAQMILKRPLRLKQPCNNADDGDDEPYAEWNVAEAIRSLGEDLTIANRGLSKAEGKAPLRVLKQTTVVLCTLSSTHKVFQLQEQYVEEDTPLTEMRLCIINEAGTVAECYLPVLIKLEIQRLVLIGDDKQLGPLVKADRGDDAMVGVSRLDAINVRRSFMERALKVGVKPHEIMIQYRLPSYLCRLLSDLFYEGKLTKGNLNPWRDVAMLRWLNVTWGEEEDCGTSKVNISQILAVERLLREDEVLSRDDSDSTVLIMGYYKPQVDLTHAMLKHFHFKRLKENDGKVEVATVDAAQGKEAKHVVLMTVRTRHIGFTREPRRLCVALSRSQESLTIVGERSLFRQPDHWRDIVWRSELDHSKSQPDEQSRSVKEFVTEQLREKQRAMDPRKGKGKGKNSGKNEWAEKGKSKGKGNRKGYGNDW